MKKMLKHHIIEEMQIETTMRYPSHQSDDQLSKVTNVEKCWRVHERKGKPSTLWVKSHNWLQPVNNTEGP